MNELELFAALVALNEPADRAALLDQHCAGQPELRRRLERLLAAHFQSNPLLDPTNLDPLRQQVASPAETADYAEPGWPWNSKVKLSHSCKAN